MEQRVTMGALAKAYGPHDMILPICSRVADVLVAAGRRGYCPFAAALLTCSWRPAVGIRWICSSSVRKPARLLRTWRASLGTA
jgi:hypothetical protein